jgi:hypothetical protein
VSFLSVSHAAPPSRLRTATLPPRRVALDEILPTFHENGRYADPIVDWSTELDDPAVQTELRSVLTSALEEAPGPLRRRDHPP